MSTINRFHSKRTVTQWLLDGPWAGWSTTKLSSAGVCEIAAPIPYEGDAHFHVRLFHLQDLYMKKTSGIPYQINNSQTYAVLCVCFTPSTNSPRCVKLPKPWEGGGGGGGRGGVGGGVGEGGESHDFISRTDPNDIWKWETKTCPASAYPSKIKTPKEQIHIQGL